MAPRKPEAGSGGRASGRSAWWRRLLLALGAVTIFAGSFVATLAYHVVSGVAPGGRPAMTTDVLPGDPFNILVLGVDLPQSPGAPTRSDTMMLVSVDELTATVSLISIPRDSYVTLPQGVVDRRVPAGPTKITHAHAFGGPELAVAAAAQVLGVPIHRYVEVDVEAFRRIVDLVGGVEVCIDKPMDYEDPYQDLYIHLKPGCQRLDGEKAMQYVRYRNDSDIARIQRQQQFVRALAEEAASIGLIPRLPAIAGELASRVRTDLSPRELAWLAGLAARHAVPFDPSRIRTATLPGRDARLEGAGWVWLLDEQGVAEIVQRLVWRIDPERNASVTVAIQDAGAGPAAVAHVTERLRALGYQVALAGELPAEPASRLVAHRADDVTEGLALRALRPLLPALRSQRRVESEAAHDLTLVLGKDAAGAGR